MSKSTRAQILLVEDTLSLAYTYMEYLKPEPYAVTHAATGADALAAIDGSDFDVVLLDLNLPDMDGLDILRRIKRDGIDATVVVITAHGSVNVAVDCMREGARDFIVKPFAAERLKVTLRNVIEVRSLSRTMETISLGMTGEGPHGFVGRSPEMQAVYRIVDSAAASDATAFIVGESGTGKEVCAEAIHKTSRRRNGPFVALNCSAIPHGLIESELFGHVKGAFTGATNERDGAAKRADGGTLFLDEIGEMEVELQSKLLRLIQSKTFTKVGGGKEERTDVRFVCATNRDPLAEVQAGRFREDLYYRLNVIPIQMPALRERGGDVALLAETFLKRFAKEEGKAFAHFDDEAMGAMTAHPWPGNVRELQNVIRNIVVLNDGEIVSRAMLPPLAVPPGGPAPRTSAAPMRPAGGEEDDGAIVPLADIERRAIERAIALCGGNIPKAAALLDVAPSTIYRKKQAWGG